jgi:predicted dehydrogenase
MLLKQPVSISRTLPVAETTLGFYARYDLTDHKTGFFVAFAAQSGGIFVDMGVHDVSNFTCSNIFLLTSSRSTSVDTS